MDVADAIRTKRAIRNFQARPLAQEDILAVLNAGRLAQSSKNQQAWHFVAIQDRSILQALSKCGEWAGHLEGAALGVAILTPDPTEKFQTMFDAGQSAAYMQLAAWNLGIASCPASIYEIEKARGILRFPADLHLRIMLSFGYAADDQKARATARRGGRRPLNAVVHFDTW
jgi:nitroreductase